MLSSDTICQLNQLFSNSECLPGGAAEREGGERGMEHVEIDTPEGRHQLQPVYTRRLSCESDKRYLLHPGRTKVTL